MCGITGWVNIHENISYEKKILENMTNVLCKRGPDDFGYYISKNAMLGHRRLIVVDPTGGAQPMTRRFNGNLYTIVYNGELYNTEDVRKILKKNGFEFNSYSDTEVLLCSYVFWGEECVKHINGIYAFGVWDENNKSLFLARDPLGVKPLFYALRGNSLIFASEIKALLSHPLVDPIVDRDGLCEIFGLGPAKSLDSGVFKGIKQLPPAHLLTFAHDKVTLKEYWKLKSAPHSENLKDTIEHTRNLLIDAIERQLVSDVPVCTFLSGGLDSSAISAIAANYFRRNGKGTLNTYSIDYVDNDKFFKANEFQPNSDSDWTKKVSDFIGSNHHFIMNDTPQLAASLVDAVIANDMPGMADVDSSLYLFCKEVRKDATVALSGECADEIFGGYPWYTREEDINSNTFPWSKAVKERRELLSKEFSGLPLEDYVQSKYEDTLKMVPHLENETSREHRMKELFFLNIKWFMITLLTRKDRMSMSNSLEVRVPFADYRIVEYAFNIPSQIKLLGGREKGLLRKSLEGILPDDVVKRKKSPYPKTYNPSYLKVVQGWMQDILNDSSSPILPLIDRKKVQEIVDTGGKSFGKPWFGQLMTGPQLIAYLIQVNVWLKKYNIQIEC